MAGSEDQRTLPHLFVVRPARALSTEPMRILIVDEDRETTESLEQLLHTLGYSETRVAHSGKAALEVAGEFRPGIVLLELDLPDTSAYEVAQLMRERAQVRDLRLIALTASRKHAGREAARAAGFERYLLKPVRALALEELLETQHE